MGKIETVITARERDLGGFSVRRLLPYFAHRMVGPFIFLDHMGPAEFAPGAGMDVRPHPHINLATVTYLFEGAIRHRDSLGSDQLIQPGAISWMTAGRGIVHSERTPAELRARGHRVNGLQCWVALPAEHEETEPTFAHHPAESLPEFKVGGARVKLLLGTAFGRTSPVKIHSDLFYADVNLQAGADLPFAGADREAAVYVIEGRIRIDGQDIPSGALAVLSAGTDFTVEAPAGARVMLLGGRSVGPRNIFWNFVSSSKERLEDVKADWRRGPRADSARFRTIPGDDGEFIPLPAEEPAHGH